MSKPQYRIYECVQDFGKQTYYLYLINTSAEALWAPKEAKVSVFRENVIVEERSIDSMTRGAGCLVNEKHAPIHFRHYPLSLFGAWQNKPLSEDFKMCSLMSIHAVRNPPADCRVYWFNADYMSVGPLTTVDIGGEICYRYQDVSLITIYRARTGFIIHSNRKPRLGIILWSKGTLSIHEGFEDEILETLVSFYVDGNPSFQIGSHNYKASYGSVTFVHKKSGELSCSWENGTHTIHPKKNNNKKQEGLELCSCFGSYSILMGESLENVEHRKACKWANKTTSIEKKITPKRIYNVDFDEDGRCSKEDLLKLVEEEKNRFYDSENGRSGGYFNYSLTEDDMMFLKEHDIPFKKRTPLGDNTDTTSKVFGTYAVSFSENILARIDRNY